MKHRRSNPLTIDNHPVELVKKPDWRRHWSWLPVLAWLCVCGFSAQAAPIRPILVVTNTANLFSQYYSEILLAEGLNEFDLADVSTISGESLASYDVVILGESALTPAQVNDLAEWVDAGGQLIAMRPDKQLAGLLGIADTGSDLSEGYLLVNKVDGHGVGIVEQTMQFHGTADRYTLDGAFSVATLYSNAVSATVNPAVTVRNVGANGGQAAAFTFDLARSVVCTRQGNPAWSGQDRDDLPPIRPNDLFYGAARSDPQPDYVDLNKVAIPQADEQQRLLANMILTMESGKKLLPRFWYFPHGYKAVIVMTGDDHGNGGTAGRFDHYIAMSPPHASVPDWQAIRGTSYIFPKTPLTDAQASAYNAAGFEISLHLNTGCDDYTPDSLHTLFTNQLDQFENNFPSLPFVTTHRVHCLAWSSYTTMPEEEQRLGIRLDTSYYFWPAKWVANRPGMFTGSGMPMRFARTNGSIINVYQAPTQMTDESGQSYPFTVDTLLDRALGPEGYYGAFVANMHTDYADSPGSDAIVNSAIHRGVPVISARQLLIWLDGRNDSTFDSIDWTNNTLFFSVTAGPNARGLQGMVPIAAGYRIKNITCNDAPIGYTMSEIKGIQYASFPAVTGNYTVSFLPDVVPRNDATEVNPVSNVRFAFRKAVNASAVNLNSFVLRDLSNSLVPFSLSINVSTFTTALPPASFLPPATTTRPTTGESGVSGIMDLAGIPLAGLLFAEEKPPAGNISRLTRR